MESKYNYEYRNNDKTKAYSVFPMMKGSSPRRHKTEQPQKKQKKQWKIGEDEKQFLCRMKKAKDIILSHNRRKKYRSEQKSQEAVHPAQKQLQYDNKEQRSKFTDVVYLFNSNSSKIKHSNSENKQSPFLRECRCEFMDGKKSNKSHIKQFFSQPILEESEDQKRQQFKPISISVSLEKNMETQLEPINSLESGMRKINEEVDEKRENESPVKNRRRLQYGISGKELELKYSIKDYRYHFPPFHLPKSNRRSVGLVGSTSVVSSPKKNKILLSKLKPLNCQQKSQKQEIDNSYINNISSGTNLRQKIACLLNQNNKAGSQIFSGVGSSVQQNNSLVRQIKQQNQEYLCTNFNLQGWEMHEKHFLSTEKDDCF